MKTPKLLTLAVMAILANAVALQAADMFLVSVRGSCRSSDGDRLVRHSFNTATLLRDFAASQETETDARNLRLVYDLDGDRLAVATADGEILGSLYDFGFPTVAANGADSDRERHVFLFAPGGSDAIGSAIISERLTRNGNGDLTRLRARGALQFVHADTTSGITEICSGTFTSGRRLVVKDTSTVTGDTTGQTQ